MTQPSRDSADILVIRTLGLDWGVAGDDLEETIAHRKAVRAPGSPPFIEGIVRYRDGLLPVVDLARRFRLPPGSPPAPPPPPEGRRTLVVRISGGLAGLTVDEVVGSRGAQEGQVVPLPRLARSPVARGCLVGPAGDLLVVLDPRRILETAEPLDLPWHAGWGKMAEERRAEEAEATPPALPDAPPSALPTGPSPRPAGDEADILVIRTLGLDWGVAGDDLEETIAYRKAVGAPGSPPFIEGIVRYRDGLLPVVDLARRFRLPPGSPPAPPPPPEGRRTLVVRISGGLAGLTVDEVVGSRGAQEGQVVPLPRLARSPVARGCLVGPAGDLLVVLDPRRILETEEPLDLPWHAGWGKTAEERRAEEAEATPPALPDAPPSALPTGPSPRPAGAEAGVPPSPVPPPVPEVRSAGRPATPPALPETPEPPGPTPPPAPVPPPPRAPEPLAARPTIPEPPSAPQEPTPGAVPPPPPPRRASPPTRVESPPVEPPPRPRPVPEPPPRPRPILPPPPAPRRPAAARADAAEPRRTPADVAQPSRPAAHAGTGAPARPAPPEARRRRRKPGRWVAAAAVLMALGAGLLFAGRQAGDEATRVASPPSALPGAPSSLPAREVPAREEAAAPPSSRLVLTLEERGPGASDASGEEGVLEIVEYTVVRGDTLWGIARRFTRNPFRYREIASDNDLRNPDLIFPGQALTLRIRRLPLDR